jgi:hypothetical protein
MSGHQDSQNLQNEEPLDTNLVRLRSFRINDGDDGQMHNGSRQSEASGQELAGRELMTAEQNGHAQHVPLNPARSARSVTPTTIENEDVNYDERRLVQ